jgi:hypothetical protein
MGNSVYYWRTPNPAAVTDRATITLRSKYEAASLKVLCLEDDSHGLQTSILVHGRAGHQLKLRCGHRRPVVLMDSESVEA